MKCCHLQKYMFLISVRVSPAQGVGGVLAGSHGVSEEFSPAVSSERNEEREVVLILCVMCSFSPH